jgi:hypothetical protein
VQTRGGENMKKRSKVITLLSTVCLITIFVSVFGCQPAVKKIVEKKTGVEIETEKNKPLKKVDTSDLLNELIYPGSKATERVKITLPQGESIQVDFETSDNVSEIEKYYDKEPVSAGWKQAVKLEQETIVYSFSKDKSWATITIRKEDNKIKIMVQYIKEMKN